MKPMKLKNYQKWQAKDIGDVQDNLDILGLRFAGEAGELAQAIGKREPLQDIVLEMGDTLYYLVRIARYLGYSLEEIAAENVNKLKKRVKKR